MEVIFIAIVIVFIAFGIGYPLFVKWFERQPDTYTAPDYPHQKHDTATSSYNPYAGEYFTDAMTGLVQQTPPGWGLSTGTNSLQWSGASGSPYFGNYGPYPYITVKPVNVLKCSWCGSHKTSVRCDRCGGE